MFSTADMAEILNTKKNNINYYIRQGFLKAVYVKGHYFVEKQVFYSFKEEYYDANKRHSARGKSKKLSHTQIKLLSFVIADIQNNNLELNDFIKKYNEEAEIIPNFQDFTIYKRDNCILRDKQKGQQYRKIADNYNLSIRSIEEIVKNHKENTI